MRCNGNSSEWCGGANRMIVYHYTCQGNLVPNG